MHNPALLLEDFLPRRHFHLPEAAADVCSFNMASGRRGGRAGARRPLSASARTAGGDNAALSIPALPPLSFPKEPVQQACALGSVKPTGSNLNCHCGGCKSLDEPCHPSCLIFLGAVLSTHLAVARSKGGDRCRAEGLSPGQCGINTVFPFSTCLQYGGHCVPTSGTRRGNQQAPTV